MSSRFAFFEGQIVPIEQAKISITTHALNYGTAAFGGVRGYWNPDEKQLYLFRPLDHFTRLLNSGRLLMMKLPYTPEQLTELLIELLRREEFQENVYVRPLVYKASEGIGVRLHDLRDELSMFAVPYGSYLGKEDGIRVGLSSWRRVDDNAIPARGKLTGAYVNSALIKTEAVLNGYDEALVLSDDGHISEGSAANFFMVRNGTVITPPVSANVLEGITRRTVMTLLSDELGIPVIEREIDRTEVYMADEAFFSGTGVQIAAITEVDRRVIGNGATGPIVNKVRDLFFEVVQGKVEKYREWVQPVYVAERETA